MRWRLASQLGLIQEEAVEEHQEEIDKLESAYDDIVSNLESWEERAQETWSSIADKLFQEKPDLPEIPKPRPANEPDGFVLFDSRRDYFKQIDAYREWQWR